MSIYDNENDNKPVGPFHAFIDPDKPSSPNPEPFAPSRRIVLESKSDFMSHADKVKAREAELAKMTPEQRAKETGAAKESLAFDKKVAAREAELAKMAPEQRAKVTPKPLSPEEKLAVRDAELAKLTPEERAKVTKRHSLHEQVAHANEVKAKADAARQVSELSAKLAEEIRVQKATKQF